ncbi:MAG: hypothetical protein IKU11_00910 [Clostridia bacterium]|nr:hypothetical protein [Clostridia bacterium]
MPKKRKDCFLGIHFDFHAMPGEVVAHHFDPDVFCEMLDRVKPDFMQFDTKGHAGLSSYPTAAGTQATEIRQDMLRFLREETEKRDIALYGHHSGLYDQQVIQDHPDWAVINADGTRSDSFLSPFSPYVDEILIPQLKELALDYKLNGAWVDGDAWGTYVDYSLWAQSAYGKTAPRPGEADYEAYREFCRQGFFQYVSRYLEALKTVAPDFEITSNWIFSPHMPHPVCVPVDYLSGDYDCSNAVVSGRRNGRFFAARGLTWDLMSWGQNAIPLSWSTHNRTTKGTAQYMQEAASIVALGGGYQFFNIAYCAGGYIQRWALPIWEETAKFCRERQICHGAKPWSNIAVMVPNIPTRESDACLFRTDSPGMLAYYAWMDALCECGFSPDVFFESELDKANLSEYDLLILPTPAKIPESYTGSIILDGGGETRLAWLSDGERLAAMEVGMSPKAGEPFGEIYSENYFEHDSIPTPSAYKDGNTFRLAFDFAAAYRSNVSTVIKNWLKNLIDATDILLPVQVSGSSFVEVVTTRKGNDLLVSLINMNGDHRRPEVRSFDEIPPLYNLTLRVGEEVRPIPRLDIHTLEVFKDYFL